MILEQGCVQEVLVVTTSTWSCIYMRDKNTPHFLTSDVAFINEYQNLLRPDPDPLRKWCTRTLGCWQQIDLDLLHC